MAIKRILTFPGQGHSLSQEYLRSLQSSYDLTIFKEILSNRISTSFTNRLLQERENYNPSNFLGKTSNSQPAIVGLSSLITSKLKEHDIDIKPDYLIGHSLGELSTFLYNDIIDIDLGLYLARKRGKYMEQCIKKGGERKKTRKKFGLFAVLIPRATPNGPEIVQEGIDEHFKDLIYISNINSERQIVISGDIESLKIFGQILKKTHGLKLIKLTADVPFHSPYLREAEEKFTDLIAKVGLLKEKSLLKYPIISNIDGKVISEATEALLGFTRCFTKPVQFAKSIQQLNEGDDKYRFINLGPNGNVIQGLVKSNLRDDKIIENEVLQTPEEIASFKLR
ncbi:hypothetical protein WICMUC_003575 [Wickerhamomyces mucosus]|uniref:[acyl-carrier-protein] S-malonyltransferase n=1 Tax=Wickerhamomyces mucosus TaxID=1378264 RepID=A0A9P8PKT4_9ASCO|nr:hypothetical protein WICMUC_003575 [Wickerhamomyces mucosus]